MKRKEQHRHRMPFSSSWRGIFVASVVVAVVAPAAGMAPRTTSTTTTNSIVTGANGYVGRAVVHRLLLEQRQRQERGRRDGEEEQDDDRDEVIICLVRPQRVAAELEYWSERCRTGTDVNGATVKVMPYDMLDGGSTFRDALDECETNNARRRICCYHVASVFGPTDDHRQTALDNVRGTEDLIRTLAEKTSTDNYDDGDDDFSSRKLILTSSMAAVRASGQEPRNGKYYTEEDWNTLSELGTNWGASYQWSKAESERRAWELCREHKIPMSSLCPSFVFGPPHEANNSGSYSLTLVGQWVRGESPVQSRLYVDVRDVAAAHVAAGRRPDSDGKRFIVSTEARAPSSRIASWLEDVCRETGLGDPSMIHYDADFDGGAVPIGNKEVDATMRLEKELGITLRPVKETILDMAKVLLEEEKQPTL